MRPQTAAVWKPISENKTNLKPGVSLLRNLKKTDSQEIIENRPTEWNRPFSAITVQKQQLKIKKNVIFQQDYENGSLDQHQHI